MPAKKKSKPRQKNPMNRVAVVAVAETPKLVDFFYSAKFGIFHSRKIV